MTDLTCVQVKERWPAFVRGEVGEDERTAMDRHLAACETCAAEVELLRHLRSTTPVPREGLAAEIRQSLARERTRSRPSWSWRLPAAAAVVVALGTALVWQRVQSGPDASQLAQESFLTLSATDTGLLGDAPALDDLSEEELTILFQEMEDLGR